MLARFVEENGKLLAVIDMRSIVMGLSMSDFYKSLTTHVSSQIWQDVYRPRFHGRDLYLKLTVMAEDDLLIVSFKRR